MQHTDKKLFLAAPSLDALEIRQIESVLGHEFAADMYYFFVDRNQTELFRLREAGLLGPKAEDDTGPWFNIAAHSMLVAGIARTAAALAGASVTEIADVTRAGLLHDLDKREQRIALAEISSKPEKKLKHLEFQRKKTGLIRVTGVDLKDYENYSRSEMALRYADSCAGKILGKEAVLPFERRIAHFERERQDYNTFIGKRVYKGARFSDILRNATRFCEANLFALAAIANQDSARPISVKSDFFAVVRGNMENMFSTGTRKKAA